MKPQQLAAAITVRGGTVGRLLGCPAAAPIRSRKRWAGVVALPLMCPLAAWDAHSSDAESAAEFIPAYPLRQEIARLEQQGVLPKLDHGTDIRGPDANNNGVRDDIEAYITALPLTTAQNKAAMQRARNQQANLLVDSTNKQAVVSLSEQSIAAAKCMADVFEGASADWSGELSLKIEAITANTPERAKRYMQYMAALSGTSVSYPRGDTCEE